MAGNRKNNKHSTFIRRSGWLRFIKFGTVGLSGTVVNLSVLYFGQEWLLKEVQPESMRLHLSLGAAILLATVNNFSWNRVWTWRDRKDDINKRLIAQLGQYFLACWLAICLQFLLTTVLSTFIHYLAANIFSIGLSAIINYILNDKWTFSIKQHTIVSTGRPSPYIHDKKQLNPYT